MISWILRREASANVPAQLQINDCSLASNNNLCAGLKQEGPAPVWISRTICPKLPVRPFLIAVVAKTGKTVVFGERYLYVSWLEPEMVNTKNA